MGARRQLRRGPRDERPFHTLRYVGVPLVPRRLYAGIREAKLNYVAARDRVAKWRRSQSQGVNAEVE